MWITIRVRKFERGLLFKHGDFAGILQPGKHRLWSRLFSAKRAWIERYSMLNTVFEHPLLDVIAGDERARTDLQLVELSENQRALVWRDERLFKVLGPGRHAFWKHPHALRVEVFDISTVRFEHPNVQAVWRLPGTGDHFTGVKVDAHETVLVHVNGRLFDRLNEGLHLFWREAGRIEFSAVDLREQSLDVAGQEIMTSDKVTLRVNLVVTAQVVDALRTVERVNDWSQALYREAQLGLRAAIGQRSLDELLADKQAVGAELLRALDARAAEFGVAVRSVGLRDIILPGEMKMILNKVIEAEKQAQANLIKRREETAAARSQANTAKLMERSPVLARMKELELLQEVLAGAKTTFVFGSGDLPTQVRSLVTGLES